MNYKQWEIVANFINVTGTICILIDWNLMDFRSLILKKKNGDENKKAPFPSSPTALRSRNWFHPRIPIRANNTWDSLEIIIIIIIIHKHVERIRIHLFPSKLKSISWNPATSRDSYCYPPLHFRISLLPSFREYVIDLNDISPGERNRRINLCIYKYDHFNIRGVFLNGAESLLEGKFVRILTSANGFKKQKHFWLYVYWLSQGKFSRARLHRTFAK